ncbi:lipoprotein insertase outer membrane protein LolB [Methylotuvimicrobium alcaliphilum]|uniref:Outer-membrane lipoprotein LolB n=1 Tax=Methylotuvimicrobium alcaliphilum (strain DSM 19304 / NCIMB 14124 / VKM B-2133 / 20Z) TaxID=1091494 RepID=G4SU85_META2|nr:lipoprotein insertase outer membrane protein LolB [Methylotuvimicrobium alcaliphilum]CCE25034.1 Outer membrane lipoprotein LolB (modular protein) [Methylotuvimicrobium alcaliphilum 20Z]
MRKQYTKSRYGWSVLVLSVLTGCSTSPIKDLAAYSELGRGEFYQLREWSLDGRVSLTAQHDSWTAAIEWRRADSEEMIRVSGPFGQGAVDIHIADDYVDVDRGGGAVRYYDWSDEFITEQLGFYVPLRSLRYWVVGLTDPNESFENIGNGFIQDNWTIRYRKMQKTDRGLLPYKIDVSNPEVKLKLIIDQWNTHE